MIADVATLTAAVAALDLALKGVMALADIVAQLREGVSDEEARLDRVANETRERLILEAKFVRDVALAKQRQHGGEEEKDPG